MRSYSIHKHDTTLKTAFGAIFFADFNTVPPTDLKKSQAAAAAALDCGILKIEKAHIPARPEALNRLKEGDLLFSNV